MTFVETAREFRADSPEKGIELHKEHHNHVIKALEDFHKKLQEELTSSQVIDVNQGPNEKRALTYLEGFLSLPFTGEIEKNKLRSAQQAIKIGKFQKLQRDVNNLKKNLKKTPMKAVELLDAILQIIDKYPLETSDDEIMKPMVTVKTFDKFKPEIIISESFKQNN